jgi:RNA polymerase sigma factor (sigma-70 family)
MAGAHLGAALRQIHGLFEAGTVAGLTDGQLLDRYLARRDESAFAALVMRHGPMVLGVCHSILHGAPEVEDAFQATFLVLIRKAGTIRGRDAVGGWLHRVAHRVAVQAGRDRSRTGRREQRGGDLPDDIAAREAPDVDDWLVPLHEEVARLPERLRQPIALCYLEGKTHAQAAFELQWSEATLRRRLADARDRLRARLTRRGVTVTASALAVAMATPAPAAVPPGWVDALARVAAGPGAGSAAPAAAARLAGKFGRRLVAGRIWTVANVATVLLTLGLAAGHVVPAGPVKADDPGRSTMPATSSAAVRARRSQQPAGKPEPEKEVTVRGRVLDPDGRPFAGAKLSVPFQDSHGDASLAKGRSGPDGRFRFRLTRSDFRDCSYDPLEHINVAATADGMGLGWDAVRTRDGEPDRDADLTLRLVKDVPIDGRILNLEGKPVAGARLTVDFIRAFAGEDLTSYIQGARNGLESDEGARLWFGSLPGQPGPITTDALGRFRLAGAGRERLIRFELEGPGIQSLHVFAATRVPEKNGDMILVKRSNGYDIHSARFDYTAKPSRPIRGMVREKRSGRPVVGAVIRSDQGDTLARATTDAQGRFELLGYPKSSRYSVTATPAEGQPFFSMQREVGDTAGLGPIQVDFELVGGIVVRGRLTDGETSEPVKGELEYYPLHTNPHAETLGTPRFFRPSSRSVTDAQGNYAAVALPGPGVLAGAAWGGRWDRYLAARIDRQELKRVAPQASDSNLDMFAPVAVGGPLLLSNYNELKLISPPDGPAQPLRQDISLRVGRTITGRVVGPDGKPLAGVRILGGTSHLFDETTSNASGEFSISALDPEKTRPLNLLDVGGKRGYSAEIRGDQPGPLTVHLQACGAAFGRIADEHGQPLKDRALVIHRVGYVGSGDYSARTDAAGCFRVEGLVPGQPYEAEDSRGRRSPYKGFTVGPGEAKDLGDARIRP